ncbi:hypothetical protein BN1263540043 [Stenotrophomonas indicatrix]|nr:hypothetical protein BN1263540043 [Stenotrophomonas indicatrix]
MRRADPRGPGQPDPPQGPQFATEPQTDFSAAARRRVAIPRRTHERQTADRFDFFLL